MTPDMALQLTESMFWTAIKISAPILGVSLLVGLLVSVFQVVTQIQEMTLTFVPKTIAIVAVIFFFGHWMLSTLMTFATYLITNIPSFI